MGTFLGTLNAFLLDLFKKRKENATHVFDSRTLSAIDRWSLELAVDDNRRLVSVSQADARIHQMDELSDSFLALEYAVRNA